MQTTENIKEKIVYDCALAAHKEVLETLSSYPLKPSIRLQKYNNKIKFLLKKNKLDQKKSIKINYLILENNILIKPTTTNKKNKI